MTPTARLRESARRTLRRAGWPGWLGLALLALAFAIGVGNDTLSTQRRTALTAERAQLLRGASASVTGSAPVVEFLSGFPSDQALPRTLARLYESADQHGLNVERTEYRNVNEAGTPLSRVSLQLPAQGSFAALYAWLNETLGSMPEVGLESIVVRHAEAEAAQIDAEVRLLVFVKRE
ncbi:hypothetical protein [Propionivibrio limicola]|uniref:hypothetical protein n=1 Tax=Propionivibrio limicola TaxID=167645 RepID=UPI00129172BB|nr:hypothetical protein [Propionivibrio limicola]